MGDATDERLYNSVVIDNYLSYISENYPKVPTGQILSEAGIKLWEVSDPGHWFTQKQVNAFHDAISRRIKDTSETSLARSVGRFTASERSNKFMRLAVIHLLRLGNVFPIAGKIISKFIKSIDVKLQKIHNCKYELIITYRESVRPRKFQCDNFIGHVEAYIYVFRNKWPKVEHPECFFSGHDCCKYIISWDEERHYRLNRFRYVALVFIVMAAVILTVMGMYLLAVVLMVTGLALLQYLKIYSELLEKRSTIAMYNRNEFQILDLYDAMGNFHDYTSAFGEAAKSISSRSSVANVLDKFAKSLRELGYDKGLISLQDDKSGHLYLRHIFGYGPTKRGVVGQCKNLPLGSSHLKTIQMYDSMEDLRDVLPAPIMMELGGDIASPLVIPMIYENSLIGIIVAQNTRGHSKLTGSDVALVQAVASQTALVITNISAFETVAQSEKLKNKFLSIASHQLRTPIQAIFLAYDDLNDQLGDEKAVGIRRSLTAIGKGVNRLENIVDTLLNMNKIEARDSLEEHPVHIHELIDQAVYETEHVIRRSNHLLVVKNGVAGDERIICDGGLLVQVVTNLINNAAKFTENEGRIIIRAYRNKAELAIDIIDNGRGIPEHAHDKVFMKFYQADDDSGTIENDGCGLGLSFCKEVVQKHGGFMSLTSPICPIEYSDMELTHKRKGALFRVHLPLDRLASVGKEKVY